ncbi:MAG: hypothetical protein OEW21_05455 [Betaproteobacteria bacterium]|nr:hypothetical protein [Betaproteobacteria bacterium]
MKPVDRTLWWRVLAVMLLGFASAAAFSAYLRPGMLIQFANLLLCY